LSGIWSDLVAWVEFALVIAVAALMIWRRLYKEFPFLAAYFVVEICIFIVRRGSISMFTARSMPYFYAYWISEAFTVLAAFAVLYEIFLIRMFPSFHSTPIARYLLPSLVLLAVLLASLMFFLAPHHAPRMLTVVV